MRAFRRGFRSFRRHPAANLVVVLLLFVCLTFSLSMLAVKLAADSQTKAVKGRVGNYGEIRSSSGFMMSTFEREREKSEAERAREARGMSEEEELEERAKTLVPEGLADDFSRQPYVLTYDKVLTAGVSVPGIKNVELASMLNLSKEIKEGAAASGITEHTFVFEGNTNGASASEFLNGSKRLVAGVFYTYADHREANPVVLVEKNLAEENGLEVGDTVTALINGERGKSAEVDLEIVGIYETVEAERQSQKGSFATFNPAGNKFFAPLSVVQVLNDTPGYVELGSYYFDSVDHTGELSSAFAEMTDGSGRYEFVTDQADYEIISDPLEKVGKTSLIGFGGALGACALIILLAMAIIVGGRTRELGVLKAIGATDRQVVAQYAVEVICVCLVSIMLATAATALVSQGLGDWLLSGNETDRMAEEGEGEASGYAAMMARLTERNLYKEGGLFSTPKSEKEEVELDVVYQGRMLAYGILILLGISLLGMAIPVAWISRLRPARVLSME
ncbi:MAG: ABC transporter permease [Actinobacteria bacterium]|nr:ABC transporter permease [Actinomycetota bacterium]